ncbi:DNA primase [[Eubacterium] hominis]|uniref:DNA primase n=1 Tax=[Eubacterium] hominis TaxID=2764325 RepID=UPI003A4E3CEA
MARLSDQEINQIRAKADIVDVVGHYVQLHRKGKDYRCICPFHDDHSPSMNISSEKQIYKCFVCGAGGNVFTFVKDYEKISFIEAVKKVADYAGVSISLDLDLPEKKVDPHLEALYKVCKDTIEFTHYQLNTLDAKRVKEYLYKRNITDDIIKKFELGFNPADDALYQFLHKKKHDDENLIGAGVARLTSIGYRDVFANRILIPIHDAMGNPVGFTARRLLENEEAKYINTTETDIYKKGQLIFNYHRAKPLARKAANVYLVEGAMDVLAFEKVQISNVVATLGTACTKEQIQLLKMMRARVIVCYDGDTAGKNATYKFGKLAKEQKLPFEIVDNKTGLDPDEIIDAYGKEELKSMVNKTISWIDFLFVFLMGRYDLENYSQKKEFAMEMAQEISQLENDFEQTNYYVRLRELTEFDMQVKKNEPIKKHVNQEYEKRMFLTYPKTKRHHAEYEILSQMLNGIAACNRFKEDLGFLKDDTSNKLAIYIIDFYRTHDHIMVADLLDVIKEQNVKTLLLEIASWELARNEVNMEVLKEAIANEKASLIEDQIQMMNSKIKEMHDPLEKAKLAVERNKLIVEKETWIHASGRK